MTQFYLGLGTGLGIAFVVLTIITMVNLYKLTKRYRVDQEDLQAMISHQDRELNDLRKDIGDRLDLTDERVMNKFMEVTRMIAEEKDVIWRHLNKSIMEKIATKE